MKNDVAIIIPAYNPTKILIDIIKKLKREGYRKIIVINDGSEKDNIFEIIKEEAIILKHDKNLGKGRALKTGFEYCLDKFSDILYVVTVDADGQHLIKDVNNVYNKIKENSKCLLLGSRKFTKKKMPFKSLIGNKIMKLIFFIKTKEKINDTQTGLRAIPFTYLSDISKINGEGFEYETNMLLYAIKQKINIIEKEIEIVYIEQNKESNFKAIKDSTKIIKTVCSFKNKLKKQYENEKTFIN